MKFTLTKDVLYILQELHNMGYEAYLVGGCVRDMLMGIVPKDYDFCTNATPQQVQICFKQYTCITNGIKHGTIGVVISHKVYEITTYRSDGEYTLHRKPKQVQFVTSLQEDLMRRDFTMNAIAYNVEEGIIDVVSGCDDIQNKMIRSVGDAHLRFQEDALRIIRALRFQATYAFAIDEKTAQAIREHQNLLTCIAKERLEDEFKKVVLADDPSTTLLQYKEVFANYITYIQEVQGRSLSKMHLIPKNYAMRLAYLFSSVVNKSNFYEMLSACKIAKSVIQEMRIYVSMQKQAIPQNKIQMKYWIQKYDAKQISDILIYIQCIYDIDTSRLKKWYEGLLQENACCTLNQLAINGNDLQAMNIPKGRIYQTLLTLSLEEVMQERIKNTHEDLCVFVQKNLYSICKK